MWSCDNTISLAAGFDFDTSESGFDTIYGRLMNESAMKILVDVLFARFFHFCGRFKSINADMDGFLIDPIFSLSFTFSGVMFSLFRDPFLI
jgi:hypothetical protein